MSISTNYTNYSNTTSNYGYYKSSNVKSASLLAKALQNASVSTTDSTTSTASSTSSTSKTSGLTASDWDLLKSSFSGLMFQNALLGNTTSDQTTSTDGVSDISSIMATIKSDIDAIKSTDIESMTADEIKETLTNLQNDLKSMPNPHEAAQTVLDADLTTMSDTEMKDLLTRVQTDAQSRGKGPGGPGGPGGPPPMDNTSSTDDTSESSLAQILAALLSDRTGLSSSLMDSLADSDTDDSSDTDNTTTSGITTTSATGTSTLASLQDIIDKITSSYNSTDATTTSADYATQLKEALTNLFDQQKKQIVL